MRKVVAVVDLQFGSTGKGQVAGTIALNWKPDTVASANGPNAGHSFNWVDKGSKDQEPVRRKIVHTVLPVASVAGSVRNILLGPGSVIDIERLAQEVSSLGETLRNKCLIVHPNAVIVRQEHRERETVLVTIGSTMKGTAEAVIDKMRRTLDAPIARAACGELTARLFDSLKAHGIGFKVDEQAYVDACHSSKRLLVEGAQGHSLGIHTSFYPNCTSRDVSISQLWADCRLPKIHDDDVCIVGVCRTYPIRVANRVDARGRQVGYSGGCYPDQTEIDWADIGRTPELTTVTKLKRRLFTFSTKQIMEAALYNRPEMIVLTFCDYLQWATEQNQFASPRMKYGDAVAPSIMGYIRRIEAAAGCNVCMLSYGPNMEDMFGYHTRGDRQGDDNILCDPAHNMFDPLEKWTHD